MKARAGSGSISPPSLQAGRLPARWSRAEDEEEEEEEDDVTKMLQTQVCVRRNVRVTVDRKKKEIRINFRLKTQKI